MGRSEMQYQSFALLANDWQGALPLVSCPTTTGYDVAREGLERYLGHSGKSLETLLPKLR